VGFDLTKINIEINSKTKEVKLSQFPDPEILSIDSDIEYYDVQKGIINKFSEKDLTKMNKNSKEFIREKVEQSHLMLIAKNQANDTISLIQQLIESLGWELVSEKILGNFTESKKLNR
jgi:threonyl-tRNA synthetase